MVRLTDDAVGFLVSELSFDFTISSALLRGITLCEEME